ncbi:PA2169 family four-helix-bundle protein, partial [Escherichia coli]|nr:PA2169 family four-helix-bundle protein [Escherichia coli]
EETVDNGTMVSGKLFRAWMDLKSLVAPSTSESVLASCEKGEDEFKKEYKDLINESLSDFPEIVDLLQTQLTIQLGAHDHIKELRDNS